MRISTENKQKAIRLYKNKDLTITEISNITNISVPFLNKIYSECFKNGTLKPRNEGKLNNSNKRKFTEEQEKEIAIDWYEKDLKLEQLKAKWNIHPVQLQRIRNKYRDIYGNKRTWLYKHREEIF